MIVLNAFCGLMTVRMQAGYVDDADKRVAKCLAKNKPGSFCFKKFNFFILEYWWVKRPV